MYNSQTSSDANIQTVISAQENNFVGRMSRWLNREQNLGRIMVAPAIILLLVLVAYPFVLAIWLSFTDTRIAQSATGSFVGLENYFKLWGRTVFRTKVIINTIIYTLGAVPIKLALGLLLALILNRRIPFRNIIRGLILLPWVVPTSLSMIVFLWMFEPTLSILNHVLESLSLAPVSWLGKPSTALFSVMMVNIWRGTPFFAVVLLAALQGVPQDQLEAAEIDGASVIQRFKHVTIPFIMPVIIVASLFSLVRTFAEMEIVWILTRGGPFNSTHMIGTYAYQQAIQSAKIGEGAAISLFFFPAMLLIVFFQLRYLQRGHNS